VDVVDGRMVEDGCRFLQISDLAPPFDDAGFAVVVADDVIEHGGPGPTQQARLHDTRRVLRPDGPVYPAAADGWTLVEPPSTCTHGTGCPGASSTAA
jgi:hypothetical protein